MKFKFLKFSIFVATLIIIGSLFPFSALADGPVFNTFPLGFSGAENTDYPLLDARNFTDNTDFSTSESDHSNGVTADPGDTVEFVIYYHNGAADADANIAENVRFKVSLPSSESREHTVSASISADNASTVTSSQKGGNMIVKVNTTAQSLEYVTGSTKWYPNRSTTGQSLSDGIVSGSGIGIGSVRGCWNYSGFVKFRAKLTGAGAQAGDLEIQKTVSNLTSGGGYKETVDADPSDIVKFKIVVTATGGDVDGVVIRDIVPAGLTFRSGTVKINGDSSNSDLVGSGYEQGLLREGDNVEITFEAKVASASYFDNHSQTITNTANTRGTDVSTVQDTAKVRVLQGQVESTSFTLSKSTYNQTQGLNAQSVLANEGDIINYTLTYENTGNTTANDIVIEDDISDVLNHADIISYGGGTLSGSRIRFPSITVPDGVSIDKTFQVRVKPISTSQTDLTMTNTYGNRVDIQLRQPTVKGVFIPPKTGPGENLAVIFALLFTGGIFAYKKYPQLKEKLAK